LKKFLYKQLMNTDANFEVLRYTKQVIYKKKGSGMRVKLRFLLIGLAAALALAGCGAPDNSQNETPAQTAAASRTPEAVVPSTDEPSATAAAETPGQTAQTGAVTVTAVNVGYGDAILIQLGGQNFLIDTGASKASDKLLCALAASGVKKLDGVFLTHTHGDHIGGLEASAQRYDIGALYAADISLDPDKIDKLAEKLGLSLQRLSAGNTVTTDSGAVFEVLGPLVLNGDDDNDNSLVLRLKAGGLVWLFTGDMQFAEENSLMNANADIKADVLKVGNHGNPDATSDDFAKKVAPETAVISTSTEEDEDSANPRVKSALDGADIYVTQDYTLGVAIKAESDKLSAEDLKPEPANASVKISIDKKEQRATLTSDADTDISGWFIWSEKGGKLFVFPEGATIKANVPLVVACKGGSGDYIWDKKKVWKDKADEAGVLYTSGGAKAARSGY